MYTFLTTGKVLGYHFRMAMLQNLNKAYRLSNSIVT